jgi:hypothetical protein
MEVSYVSCLCAPCAAELYRETQSLVLQLQKAALQFTCALHGSTWLHILQYLAVRFSMHGGAAAPTAIVTQKLAMIWPKWYVNRHHDCP